MILCKKKFQSLSEANRISLFRYLTDFNIALSPQINNGINQRSLYFNDSSEQLLDVCCHCRRCNGRLETCNDLALAVDEELREVPLDSVARKVLRKVFLQRVRQHFGQRVRGVKALKALLRRQILKEWLRRIAPHIPLFEDGERNTIVQAAELLHLIVCARLLSCKLVAREAQNLKPLRLILRIECLQLLELRRKSALARRVHESPSEKGRERTPGRRPFLLHTAHRNLRSGRSTMQYAEHP